MPDSIREILEEYRCKLRDLYKKGLMRENIKECENLKTQTTTQIKQLLHRKMPKCGPGESYKVHCLSDVHKIIDNL